MSRHGFTTFLWGDGDNTFRLPVAGIEELEDVTKKGAERIMYDVRSADWRVKDLRQTLRIGLIHGGLSPVDAELKVRRYFDERFAFLEHKVPVMRILQASLLPRLDDPVPKRKGGAKEAVASPMDESASQTSTDGAPSSDSRRKK